MDISVQDTAEDNIKKVDELFEKIDVDSNGKLDYNEFRSAVQSNKSELEDWAESLALHQLLADSIPQSDGADALDIVSNLSPGDIDLIVEGFADGLRQMLNKYVNQLKQKLEHLSEHKSPVPKFVADVPKMMCGSIDDFHKGLVARIGE